MRGSRISRTPSPSRLKHSTVSINARPGNATSHHLPVEMKRARSYEGALDQLANPGFDPARTAILFDPVGDEFYWQRGFLVPQARAAVAYHPSRNNWGPIIVPQHHFFVLGDNRDNSLDSRYWGFVPDSLVRGRPLFVYFSYVPDSATSLDWLTHIRWKRLGARPH